MKEVMMENVEHFGKLSERMQCFRNEVLNEKPYVDAERAVLPSRFITRYID